MKADIPIKNSSSFEEQVFYNTCIFSLSTLDYWSMFAFALIYIFAYIFAFNYFTINLYQIILRPGVLIKCKIDFLEKNKCE